jgi:hypothetical protein
VLLSAMFLGEKPTLPVVLALLPIIGGVVLASTSELSFTWKGFLSGEPRAQPCCFEGQGGAWMLLGRAAHPTQRTALLWPCKTRCRRFPRPRLAAMGSNVTFQSRNVLSKKLMTKGEQGWQAGRRERPALIAWTAPLAVVSSRHIAGHAPADASASSFPLVHPGPRPTTCQPPRPPLALSAGKGALDSINTFSIITILSFLLLTPIALLTDGLVWTPAALAAAGVDSTLLAKRALLSAFAFHAYQQVRTLTCLSGTRGRMAARPAAGQLLPAQDLALDTPPRRCRWHRLPQAAVLPIASLKSMHVLPLALPAHPNPARRCRT